MQVMDIVNRAAMNCGVASSFNPDEVPEDVQARASDILRHEIIPMLNCDRSIDITEIVYPAVPQNNAISLITPPLDYENAIAGQITLTYDQLRKKASATVGFQTVIYYPNIRNWLISSGYIEAGAPGTLNETDKWPTDQFGSYRQLYVWSSDFKLVNLSVPTSDTETLDDTLLDSRYNVPFAPMRVEAMVRAADGAVFQYLHAEEMVSSEFRYAQLVYGVEDLPDRMVIRLNPAYGSQPVLIVLPVPLKIVNSFAEPNPWQGTIIAPEKFRSYLVAKLAYRLAVEYGLDTAPLMAELVKESYQALIKNLSKREHAQDIPRRINDYLERARGWRAGANGSGYAGGFNG